MRYFGAISGSCSPIFAILAMFGFVVSDSLPKLLNPSYGGRDQPVVKLFGKTVYRSALNEMLEQRTLANMFVSAVESVRRPSIRSVPPKTETWSTP